MGLIKERRNFVLVLKEKMKVSKWAKENSVVDSTLRLSGIEFQFQNVLVLYNSRASYLSL